MFFAPLHLDGSGQSVFSDQWDGYAANRARVLQGLSGPAVQSPVVLSGDVHSFWMNDLDDRSGRPVASEIVTSALGASSPPAGRFGDALANNPHVRFSDVERAGYVLLDIDKRRLTADVRVIADRRVAGSAVRSLKTFGMDQGGHRLQQA